MQQQHSKTHSLPLLAKINHDLFKENLDEKRFLKISKRLTESSILIYQSNQLINFNHLF